MSVIETDKLTKFYGTHRGIVEVDLAVELQILSYYEQRRASAAAASALHAVPGERRRGATA